jgi:hypothetical protein
VTSQSTDCLPTEYTENTEEKSHEPRLSGRAEAPLPERVFFRQTKFNFSVCSVYSVNPSFCIDRAWGRLAVFRFGFSKPANLVDEFGDVTEFFVDAREPHVGDLVDGPETLHHAFADGA